MMFDAGEGFFVAMRIFGLLGGALVIVTYVFTLLAVYLGKLLVEFRGCGDAQTQARDDRW